MRGNISKVKGVRGPQGERGEQGIQGVQGKKGDIPNIKFEYDKETGDLYYYIDGIYMSSDDIVTKEDIAKKGYIEITGGDINWAKEEVYDDDGFYVGTYYGQAVEVKDATITENSKIDLQISPEQLVIFYEKDLSFMIVNDSKEVTIYCVGQIPQNNYTIQVSVTEVV